MKIPICLIFVALVSVTMPANALEATTCSEAYQACAKPDVGHCDAGCASTCKLRFEGCLKTGSFATPRALLKNLKRR